MFVIAGGLGGEIVCVDLTLGGFDDISETVLLSFNFVIYLLSNKVVSSSGFNISLRGWNALLEFWGSVCEANWSQILVVNFSNFEFLEVFRIFHFGLKDFQVGILWEETFL